MVEAGRTGRKEMKAKRPKQKGRVCRIRGSGIGT